MRVVVWVAVIAAGCGGAGRVPESGAESGSGSGSPAPDAAAVLVEPDAEPVDAAIAALSPDAPPATPVTVKPPPPAKVDIAPLGSNGAMVALATVTTTKLTVFEFGAAWCAPCKVLEPKLAALAKQYPRDIAIRRIDVIDGDSAVALAYLVPGKFSLPHIKVKDRRGTLLLERSGDPDALAAALRVLARP